MKRLLFAVLASAFLLTGCFGGLNQSEAVTRTARTMEIWFPAAPEILCDETLVGLVHGKKTCLPVADGSFQWLK